jgi:tetratricopeptide (TPR) repeat protein
MDIEILRGELERLFGIDELTALCQDLLGLDPEEVGNTGSKASFVRALTDHCVRIDAVEALVDAVLGSRNDADPRLREMSVRGLLADEKLEAGASVGEIFITRRIGEGGQGIVYAARFRGQNVILKTLRRETGRDRRAAQRFLTASRLIGTVNHDGVPRGVHAGHAADLDLYYVSYADTGGEPLSSSIRRDGPMHIQEARNLLRSTLEALAALHDRGIAHGNLKIENVIAIRTSQGSLGVVLVDGGQDRLRLHGYVDGGPAEIVLALGSAKNMAPEQLRGSLATTRSDVYAFGTLLYEVLTGQPVFRGAAAIDDLVAHLKEEPRPPSTLAPRGWVTPDLDRFVLSLLHKNPAARPKDAGAVIEAFDQMGRGPVSTGLPTISEEEFEARFSSLLSSPEDEAAALRLESCAQEGIDTVRVAQALAMAAGEIPAGDAFLLDTKKTLYFRAARLFESASEKQHAEEVYAHILEIDPADDIASNALVQIRKSLGKYEDVIEMLLAKNEAAVSRTDKARVMAEIGRVYASDINDKAQALVAYTQAFCDNPETGAYADEIERLAGSDPNAWGEIVGTCSAASTEELAPEAKNPLFLRLGRWCSDKVARPDLAVACFQAILATEPANELALTGLTGVYEKAQQWSEVASLLLHRATMAASPVAARNLNVEAAEVLDGKLSDTARAKEIFEKVLEEDPLHAGASEGLQKILERTNEHAALVRLLQTKADTFRGDKRWASLARIAEIYEDQLNDLGEATRQYEAILAEDQANAAALKGLDRVYNRQGRYRDLLGILEREIHAAVTPRQRMSLYERMAAIYEEEFLDHEKAAEACEEILAIDPAQEEPHVALARHYRAMQRWEDVASIYVRHLKLVSDSARRVELLLALGRVLSEQVGSPARAIETYEEIVRIDPHQPTALDAIARLRATSGDARSALSAIEALAETGKTPEARAEQWVRAAKLLDGMGDIDGAIDRYKRALDSKPDIAEAPEALVAAYLARGDAVAAADLLERRIATTEGLQKARLLAQLAKLAKHKLKDDDRALMAATQAKLLDPTNIDALSVIGDLKFEEGRFLEAAAHYELPANRPERLDPAEATRVLVRYVDSLYKTGATEKAVAPVEALLKIAPNDAVALARVALVTFDHGEPKQAYELHRELLGRFRDRLTVTEEAQALYRLGESARRAGFLEFAFTPLAEAADLDPGAAEPLASLSKLYEAAGDWESVAKMKNRRLDVANGEERYQLLLDVAEIYSAKLGDRTRAAKTYIVALEDRPSDRNLLTKLMQLYSEEKDWGKLIDVVVKLADFVEDKKQKAKYLQTAAKVSAGQLGEVDAALQYYDRTLELDPSNEGALEEAIALRTDKGDFRGVETLLKFKLERANEEPAKMLTAFDELAVLYHKRLGWISEAIDAYEAAQTLDPENKQRSDILATLYASDPSQYLDKAVTAHRAILKRNPARADSYKLLRRMYTEAKRADAAWCMCQALFQLNLAEPDEERFFKRMRADAPAAARAAVADDDFARLLIHGDADPTLSAIFLVIEPAVIGARAQQLETLGYDPRYAIDLASHPSILARTLFYAAGVLGVPAPPTFENVNDPGGLSFLHVHQPSIVLGRYGLGATIPAQAAAFIAGRHLAYYRPGLYIRHLIPTGTGLKAWLFAAIKLISPQFPVVPELEGPVKENLSALDRAIVGPLREQLASLVSRLLAGGGSLDLKKWVAAIDLTADRAGFLLAHDLEVAGELVKASGDEAASLPVKERLTELVLFATGDEYFTLRQRLGVAVDS